jgi:hypothetical protein
MPAGCALTVSAKAADEPASSFPKWTFGSRCAPDAPTDGRVGYAVQPSGWPQSGHLPLTAIEAVQRAKALS